MGIEQRRQINYTVVCVSEFASRYHLSMQEAFKYLDSYKGIEFIKENYDIEHTLSLEDAIDDLALICERNGGKAS